MKRRIIFYIDNLSLAPFNRNRVFAADEGVRQERHAPRRRGHDRHLQPQHESARAVHERRRRRSTRPSTRSRASRPWASPTAASAGRSKSASASSKSTTRRSPPRARTRRRSSTTCGRASSSINAPHVHAGRRRGKEDPRPHQRRLPDAARPRDVLLHRRDRAARRAGSAGGTLLEGMTFNGASADPVRRQDRERERHHDVHHPRGRPHRRRTRCQRRERARRCRPRSRTPRCRTPTESMQLMAADDRRHRLAADEQLRARPSAASSAISTPTTPSATAPAPSASTASATCRCKMKNKGLRRPQPPDVRREVDLRGDERPRHRQPALPQQGRTT